MSSSPSAILPLVERGHQASGGVIATGDSPLTPSETRGKPRIRTLDGIRALAMLMAYTYHVWQFGESPALNVTIGNWQIGLDTLIGSFPSGVDLFMVLSGFCLFWPLATEPSKSELRPSGCSTTPQWLGWSLSHTASSSSTKTRLATFPNC